MAVFGETPLRRRRSAELRIADEVRLQAMIFIPSVTLQFSHNNPGAEEAAKELTQVVENLSIAPLPPRQSREETDFVPKTEEDAPARKFSLLSGARPRAGSKRLKSCCKPGFNLAQLALSAGAAGKVIVVPREGWENQTVGGWRKALANNKSKGDKSKGGSPNGSFNKGRDRQSGSQVLPRSSSCKARRKSSRYLPHRSDVFLLYLNNTTFLGPEGAELTAELHELMDQGGTQFVVVHEADPERAACNFAQYFQVTPTSLIDYHLYSKENVQYWFMGSHRQISLKLTALAMGARLLTAEELAERQRKAQEAKKHAKLHSCAKRAQRVALLARRTSQEVMNSCLRTSREACSPSKRSRATSESEAAPTAAKPSEATNNGTSQNRWLCTESTDASALQDQEQDQEGDDEPASPGPLEHSSSVSGTSRTRLAAWLEA